jgi:hypothetical protein
MGKVDPEEEPEAKVLVELPKRKKDWLALEELKLLTETLPVVAAPLDEEDAPETNCTPPSIRFSS